MSVMSDMDIQLADEVNKVCGLIHTAYLFGDKTGGELLMDMKGFVEYALKKYSFEEGETQ